jgi:hypothetical protein
MVLASGCGGGPDREAFGRDAGQACQDLKREIGAISDDPDYKQSIRALQRELDRLQHLSPPDDARADYDSMLRYKRESLAAWREFTEHARTGDFKAGDPALQRSTAASIRAAQAGKRLHIAGCDRALS